MSGLSVPSAQAEKSFRTASPRGEPAEPSRGEPAEPLPAQIWLTLHFVSGRAILAEAFLTYDEADDHRLDCELELFGKAANEPYQNHDCHVSVMRAPLSAKGGVK